MPSEISKLQEVAARTVHWIFYGYMVFLPLSGWMISSAVGLPVSFFGLFVLPDLIAPNKNLLPYLVMTHQWLSYALIATIGLHITAALWHHFVLKDNVLKRMLS